MLKAIFPHAVSLLRKILPRKRYLLVREAYRRLRRLLGYKEGETLYQAWVAQGRPLPPPHYSKQRLIRQIAHENHFDLLVETGTYMGDMVEAVKDEFERIFSIELSDKLYRKACERFAEDRSVTLLHGDSGTVLPALLASIDQPCLFWLDGHYSAGVTAKGALDTPIMQEVSAILAHSHADEHVILIDDANCFTGESDYPTVDRVRQIFLKHGFTLSEMDNVLIARRDVKS